MINIYSKWAIMALMVAMPLIASGCSMPAVIERDPNSGVLQEEFTKNAEALTNELNDYEEIEPLFLDDEDASYLEALIRESLKKDKGVMENHLKTEQMDLQLFQNEGESIYFVGVMQDKRQNPYTIFGMIEQASEKEYKIVRHHMAAYPVNLPKSFLLYKEGTWAIVSQRPFSTFEECYFFKLSGDQFDLFKRGWQDRSLLYYGQVQELLTDGKLAEALALPDESMYPMSYEEPLFETVNLWVEKSVENAHINEGNKKDSEALDYLDFSLNYYFQNHYGKDLDQMVSESFEDLSKSSEDVFGHDYLLPTKDIYNAVTCYANLVGEFEDEKEAKKLKTAIEKLKVNQ